MRCRAVAVLMQAIGRGRAARIATAPLLADARRRRALQHIQQQAAEAQGIVSRARSDAVAAGCAEELDVHDSALGGPAAAVTDATSALEARIASQDVHGAQLSLHALQGAATVLQQAVTKRCEAMYVQSASRQRQRAAVRPTLTLPHPQIGRAPSQS